MPIKAASRSADGLLPPYSSFVASQLSRIGDSPWGQQAIQPTCPYGTHILRKLAPDRTTASVDIDDYSIDYITRRFRSRRHTRSSVRRAPADRKNRAWNNTIAVPDHRDRPAAIIIHDGRDAAFSGKSGERACGGVDQEERLYDSVTLVAFCGATLRSGTPSASGRPSGQQGLRPDGLSTVCCFRSRVASIRGGLGGSRVSDGSHLETLCRWPNRTKPRPHISTPFDLTILNTSINEIKNPQFAFKTVVQSTFRAHRTVTDRIFTSCQ
jgi:hypothetical protein